jgi:inorganic pyrophosphatase
MIFPYAFGFISGTKGEDGDPLDAMVISNDAYFTGCHMEARLIGALEAEQKEKGKKKFRNDRYFFVPAGDDDLLFRHIKSIHDFGNEHNRQLTEFFINYNRLAGKLFKPMKLLSATEAASLLRKSNQQS